ncbi:uncharacterized protein At2g34160-like [Phalaenopsis equestris]|uniref:uncharacterized protein At2g34160-like n=1 Tax=Phalaenopsis equestris TaxID=78828 RepID=UPI0009E41142|nr:uncharacterized protein At2g34160-like [Phalaenopsis equestris]
MDIEKVLVKDAINHAAVVVEAQKRYRIQVSTNKKPVYYYVNLAKRLLQRFDEIELSALGMAIGTVVTISEILKNKGLAIEKKIMTSTVGTNDDAKGRLFPKAKIEILLGKSPKFDDLMTAEKKERSPNAGAAKAKVAVNFGEEVKEEVKTDKQNAAKISE